MLEDLMQQDRVIQVWEEKRQTKCVGVFENVGFHNALRIFQLLKLVWLMTLTAKKRTRINLNSRSRKD